MEKPHAYWKEILGFEDAGTRLGIDGTAAYASLFWPNGAILLLQDKTLVEKYEPDLSAATLSLFFYAEDIEGKIANIAFNDDSLNISWSMLYVDAVKVLF